MNGEAESLDEMTVTVSAAVWPTMIIIIMPKQRYRWTQSAALTKGRTTSLCSSSVKSSLLIHLYMRSSCAPARSWHQRLGFVSIYTFAQVRLIALYTLEENLFPSNIFDVAQNKAFFLFQVEHRDEEGEWDKLCLCTTALDGLIRIGGDAGWKVFLTFAGRFSFSTTTTCLLFVPAP